MDLVYDKGYKGRSGVGTVLTKLHSNQTVSNALHFKVYRIKLWLEFLITLPYHILFHRMDEYTYDYTGWTIKGFILCSCGHCIDMGMNYGMHCEKCYNRVTQVTERRNGN